MADSKQMFTIAHVTKQAKLLLEWSPHGAKSLFWKVKVIGWKWIIMGLLRNV
jgi:hypothetical protein